MRTNSDRPRLALAQKNFEPVARALDRLSAEIGEKLGGSAALERKGAMRQTAQNAYSVRYAFRHADEARLSLSFVVVGEDADLILMETQERAGPRDLKADPGQVDQRVYRLEKIDEIKAAVQEKIAAHLQERAVRH